MSEPDKPATAEEFLQCLRFSGLLEEPRLLGFLRQLDTEAVTSEPRHVAAALVRANLLTAYQAKFLLLGRYRGFLIGGRYKILRLLGQGGMGTVYLAQHLVMNRLVALKVIGKKWLDRPETVTRFRQEIQAAARLCHPHIVMAFDAEQVDNLHYLAMEYIEGIDLSRLLQTRGPLSVMEVCEYVRQAALGLQHAHEQGMVHRDIKPQNLMLTSKEHPQPGIIKILDFGLARFAKGVETPGVTNPGTMLGTPDFMAPEQARRFHTTDIRADIYSLGCTLYYLLTGQVPFPAGGIMTKCLQHAYDNPSSLGQQRVDVSPGLILVFQRMTAKNPCDRYQTPGEVAWALEPFAFKQ